MHRRRSKRVYFQILEDWFASIGTTNSISGLPGGRFACFYLDERATSAVGGPLRLLAIALSLKRNLPSSYAEASGTRREPQVTDIQRVE